MLKNKLCPNCNSKVKISFFDIYFEKELLCESCHAHLEMLLPSKYKEINKWGIIFIYSLMVVLFYEVLPLSMDVRILLIVFLIIIAHLFELTMKAAFLITINSKSKNKPLLGKALYKNMIILIVVLFLLIKITILTR